MPKKKTSQRANNKTAQLPEEQRLKPKIFDKQYFSNLVDKVLNFLRDSAWQGCGTLIGIASLIVTTYLTIYVFSYTQSQEIANVSTRIILTQAGTDTWNVRVQVSNYGPAVAYNLGLGVIDSSKAIDETFSASTEKAKGISEIDPSQLEIHRTAGVISRFERILPGEMGVLYFTVSFTPTLNNQLIKLVAPGLFTEENEKKNIDFIENNVFDISVEGLHIIHSGTSAVITK